MVLLTLFAMTLVVIGHSDITLDFKELWIYKWVYSFHMPLFFFISGFLFCLTMPADRLRMTSMGSFIRKKAIRLLIPFLFINTLIFIVKSTLVSDTSLMQHPVALNLESAIDATFFHPMGFMWFLPALFSIFFIAFPICKALKINIPGGGKGHRIAADIDVIGSYRLGYSVAKNFIHANISGRSFFNIFLIRNTIL